ncbi:hypothetical protein NUW54_g13994 [Trametes sanguinea]|uniref:Uncharacterized protein n=1 Tax=Trametes sanguinea TaxID=158606 RepID=A0ACC1MGP4_9APHY|nr:hypothetical protein NUW54_g13994 [Trametes sanguinea]
MCADRAAAAAHASGRGATIATAPSSLSPSHTALDVRTHVYSHAAPSFVPTAGSSQTTLPSQAFPPPQHQDPQWNVLQVSSTTVHRPPSDVMIRNSAPARVPPTMIAAVKERIARSYSVDAAVRMDDEELATIWVQMSDDGRRNTLERSLFRSGPDGSHQCLTPTLSLARWHTATSSGDFRHYLSPVVMAA